MRVLLPFGTAVMFRVAEQATRARPRLSPWHDMEKIDTRSTLMGDAVQDSANWRVDTCRHDELRTGAAQC